MSETPITTRPKTGSRARGPVLVQLPVKREINAEHLANLRASGLTDETCALADLWTEHNPVVLSDMLGRTYPRSCASALVFPMYLPGAAEPYGFRIRPTNPRVAKSKSGKSRTVKYDQAEGGMLVFFAPRARASGAYAEIAGIVFWTEGEKKALLLDQLGLVCVGLCGIWSWGDKQHKVATGEERLHPALRDHVTVAGRHHVIVYDADVARDEKNMLAAQRLAGVLLAAGALTVRFIAPPSLDAKGIDDHYVAHGEPATRGLLDSAQPIEPIAPHDRLVRVRSLRAMREAPVPEAMRVPEGYEIRRDGSLWKLAADDRHGDAQISRRVLLPQRYLEDLYTREQRVDLVYPLDDGWATLAVSRQAVADGRSLVAEATPYGAPVTSNTAGKLVDWFDAVDATNSAQIPRVTSVARAGWHMMEGGRVFVLDVPLAPPGRDVTVALDTRGDRRRMFGALGARGSLAEHTAALRAAWEHDLTCAAMICGALAAPLLQPLEAPSFAIHLPGDSSRGKTTMLKIAGSVYGDPNNPAWVASWDTTAAGAEIRASTLCDLPLIYDEVGGTDPLLVERLVYMLINRSGRTRGSADMTIRETASWRTIVLSNGERELASESAATGAQVRVLHLPVTGFGALDAAGVDALRDRCAQHAGQFGALWIQGVVQVTDWAPFVVAYRELTQRFRAHAHDPLHARVAQYFALLAITEQIVAPFGLGDPEGSTMWQLYRDLDRRQVVQSLAERARGMLSDWVLSEPEAFPVLEGVDGYEVVPASHGRVVRAGFRRQDGTVLVIPAQFRAWCERNRLAPREVIREWAQRGWTRTTAGRHDLKVRIGVVTPRFVVVLPDTEPEDSP